MDTTNGTWTNGGQNLVDIYVRKWNGTAYDFYKLNSGKTDLEVIASPTRANAKLLSLSLIEATDVAIQTGGTLNITLDQYDLSEDLIDVLNVVAVPAATAAATLPDVKLENGYLKSATTSTDGYEVIAVAYTAKASSKILMHVAAGRIEETSGSFKTGADAYNKPTFAFVGAKPDHDHTLPVGIFYTHASDPNAGMLDAEAVTTWAPALKKGSGFLRKFVAIPTT